MTRRIQKLGRTFFILFAIWHFSGCSSRPADKTDLIVRTPPVRTGARVLEVAKSLLGTPYRYGGTTPSGFDCSGFVYYAHKKAGVSVPRSTTEQFRQLHPVPLSELRSGDVIFFRLSLRKVSHVGIYAGKRKFIHAPSRGKRVSIASLDNPYWTNRLVTTGRLY